MRHESEIFFRPPEHTRTEKSISSRMYRQIRSLLQPLGDDFRIVPMRDMQFLAIVSKKEVLFVDSNGPYSRQRENSGRCICVAWEFHPGDLDSTPVPYDLVEFEPGCLDSQHPDFERRLFAEFSRSLEQQLSRQQPARYQTHPATVIPLKQ